MFCSSTLHPAIMKTGSMHWLLNKHEWIFSPLGYDFSQFVHGYVGLHHVASSKNILDVQGQCDSFVSPSDAWPGISFKNHCLCLHLRFSCPATKTAFKHVKLMTLHCINDGLE